MDFFLLAAEEEGEAGQVEAAVLRPEARWHRLASPLLRPSEEDETKRPHRPQLGIPIPGSVNLTSPSHNSIDSAPQKVPHRCNSTDGVSNPGLSMLYKCQRGVQ